MAVTAATGLSATAWAAPADESVTENQCFDGDGRVQREADGVGTCVGGTNDGLLIDDGYDHSDDGYGSSSDRDRSDDADTTSRSDDDGDRYARDDSDDEPTRSSSPAASYRF